MIVDLLENNYSYTILVVLTENFARDIFTLSPTNMEITNKPPIGATAKCEIPDSMFPYQVPIILLLFSICKIEQGSIEDKKIYESLYTYYPISKL